MRFIRILLCALALPHLANASQAQLDADIVFDWAELRYPQFFTAEITGKSESAQGYYYRCYGPQNNCLGMKDGDIYLYLNGALSKLGPTTNYLTEAAAGLYAPQIEGDASFVHRTSAALDLLKDRHPSAYARVLRYVGKIKQSTWSAMQTSWMPPTFEVGPDTLSSDDYWYAGAIAHDATHSKQYFDYLSLNPGALWVPNDEWTGRNAEIECMTYQLDVLTKINAAQYLIDYMNTIIDGSYAYWVRRTDPQE